MNTSLKKFKRIMTKHLPTLLRVELARRFPSLYASVKLKPTSAWLNVTDNCNMRCIMCNQWKEHKTGELAADEWKDVLRQLQGLGIREVCFGGGEPLLVRELPDLIAYGGTLGLSMGITTSGYLLNERKLEELMEAGVSNVTISIDGVEADYERIRRREWPNVLKGAELLARANKEKGLQVVIGFVLMKPTLKNFPGVRSLAKRLDLPIAISLVDTTPFLFQLPENSNENWIGPSSFGELQELQLSMASLKRDSVDALYNSYADIRFFGSYFRDPLQKEIPCSVAQMRIMVNGTGDVYGGCWSMGTFGNIRKNSLIEIVNSARYQNTHKRMFYKSCPGCSCGYSTNNRYYLPMQIQETLSRIFPWKRKISAGASLAAVSQPNVPVIQIREEADKARDRDASLVS